MVGGGEGVEGREWVRVEPGMWNDWRGGRTVGRKRGEEHGPEDGVPVWPVRANEGHDDRGGGAEDGGAEDQAVGGDSVGDETSAEAEDEADDDVREEAEGGLYGG